jgi:hypothetical protein
LPATECVRTLAQCSFVWDRDLSPRARSVFPPVGRDPVQARSFIFRTAICDGETLTRAQFRRV